MIITIIVNVTVKSFIGFVFCAVDFLRLISFILCILLNSFRNTFSVSRKLQMVSEYRSNAIREKKQKERQNRKQCSPVAEVNIRKTRPFTRTAICDGIIGNEMSL